MENTKSSSISIILNIILFLGLIVLYVLFFNSKNDSDESEHGEVINLPSVSSSEGSIAFVDSDLVLSEYKLVEKLSEELENERQRKNADITSKEQVYQKDAAYLQEQIQKQSISEESAQQIYAQLMATQEQLYALQERYSIELSRKEIEMNMILLDSIRQFLGRYNTAANFDYVLSYNDNGGILFAKDTFDITPQVIKGINEVYDSKFPPPPPKK